MSGLTGQAQLTRTVELKGHVIDSLTLSKVIDTVQQLGGDYRLNDIRVGSLKKDISAINMTLLAPDQPTLRKLMDAVVPYGAVVDENESVMTVQCPQDGVLPDEAYAIKLPQQVHTGGGLLPVEGGGQWALVLRNGDAALIPVSQLKQGDALVVGTHGIQW